MHEPVRILWNSQDIDKITGGESTVPWVCSGISIDTRTLAKGDLFVALKGEKGEGELFLENAYEKGAVAALASHVSKVPLPQLVVKDTLRALEKLGIAARERSNAKRIAITGSVGKTSTKDMLKVILKDQGLTHGSVSSYNNHWGVPLTLARMPEKTEFGIFEVGMNHPGEIRPLTHMIKPHIAIITTVVEAHAEFFTTEEDIARAKAEIFEAMEKGAPVLLNADNAHYSLLSRLALEKGLKVYSFGQSKEADFRLLSWEGKEEESQIMVEIQGETLSYSLPVPGLHWALNSLAALGGVSLAGADVKKAAYSLAILKPPSGRGQWYKGDFTVIDESYNANPTSMKAALTVLGKSGQGRKIAVIGDMRELGSLSKQRHEELLECLLENKIDLVFCCGPYMASLFASLPHSLRGGYAPTSLELMPLVLKEVQSGDIVSVKASLGTRVKPIVEALLVLQEKKRVG
ncbi:MAG: UDP-N-acetylmuramoyl-tripeptide--D-alanyl-D-alanine ligase [Alphaproteobacteria bacterium]|nr:UDP-N-acetylmuramoyl-tripeptide--D-alanyl-D-alanine ligase [Alphaproteobacteria bacterium]